MKRKKNTRFNLKPRTVAVIIIATIIGSMGGFLNDTLYDFSAVDENKITIKHINSIHDGDTINITTHNNKKKALWHRCTRTETALWITIPIMS